MTPAGCSGKVTVTLTTAAALKASVLAWFSGESLIFADAKTGVDAPGAAVAIANGTSMAAAMIEIFKFFIVATPNKRPVPAAWGYEPFGPKIV